MPDKRRAPYISHDRSVIDLTQLNATVGSSGVLSSMANGHGPHASLGGGLGGGAGAEPPLWIESPTDGATSNGYLPHVKTTYASSINNPADHVRKTSLAYDPTRNPNYSFQGNHVHQSQHSGSTMRRTDTSSSSYFSRLFQSPLPSPSTIKFVSLCTLWYATSAVSSNTGKVILNNFKFPVTLTIVQFFFVSGCCWCMTEGKIVLPLGGKILGSLVKRWMGMRTLTQPQAGGGSRLRSPSRAILKNTWPMAVFQVGGHIFSSMAISRVPVSTVHTIKALSPLFTVLAYALLFKISYSPATYLSLLPLTLGVMLACSFDVSASNVLGLVCAFGSTLVFVSQNIVFKKLMPPSSPASNGSGGGHGVMSGVGGGSSNPLSTAPTSAKLDKINLLFYSSGMAFLSMIPLWAYSDMPTLIALWLDPTSVHLPVKVNRGAPPNIPLYFIINGLVHFAQNLLAFAILSSTSPVTYSIASLVKRIAVICLAIIWFNQKVHPVQAVGIALTGIGLWMYNAAKRDVEKGEKKVRRMEAVKDGMLPFNRADQRLLDERSEASSPVPGEKGSYASPTLGSYGFDHGYNGSMNAVVKGAYAVDDGSVKRGTQHGYVVPYPSVSTALPSPPPSNASSPPFNATHIPAYEVQQPLSEGPRRRSSNEQYSKSTGIMTRPLMADGRHPSRVMENDQEILVDFERRKSVASVAPMGAFQRTT